MEAVSALVTLLTKEGPSGIFISIAVLICFAFVHFSKQFQELRASTISVKEKQFEQLSKLILDKDITEKPGLLIEQAFERYFGFILTADEIHHILKSKKQILAIRDLKYCRGMFKFDNNEFKYINKYKLNSRVLINNIVYWLSSMMTFLVGIYALAPQNRPLFILCFIFGITAYLSWDTSRALSAAKRIATKNYQPIIN